MILHRKRPGNRYETSSRAFTVTSQVAPCLRSLYSRMILNTAEFE